MIDLSVEIAGIRMKNPVMNACGTFNVIPSGVKELSRAEKIGAYVHKSTTLESREGNPQPRLCETAAGLINRIGLQNVGVRELVDKDIDIIRNLLPETPLIISIAGNTADDYFKLTAILVKEVKHKISGIEVNVSCPNVKDGLSFGSSPQPLSEVTSGVKSIACDLPVIVKLTPNVADIVLMAQTVEKAGADAVSLINTLKGMARMKDGQWITGGLSGKAIKPVALYMVWAVARSINLPVIGMGGISNARDALDFILAGANAIAVGTENFPNPGAMADIVDGLERHFTEKGYSSLAELKANEAYQT